MAQPREPIHDVHPLTGVNIEVFFVYRAMETFGRGNAGWFWWPRLRGCSPEGPLGWSLSDELGGLSGRDEIAYAVIL
jgi:hypothetical protein